MSDPTVDETHPQALAHFHATLRNESAEEAQSRMEVARENLNNFVLELPTELRLQIVREAARFDGGVTEFIAYQLANWPCPQHDWFRQFEHPRLRELALDEFGHANTFVVWAVFTTQPFAWAPPQNPSLQPHNLLLHDALRLRPEVRYLELRVELAGGSSEVSIASALRVSRHYVTLIRRLASTYPRLRVLKFVVVNLFRAFQDTRFQAGTPAQREANRGVLYAFNASCMLWDIVATLRQPALSGLRRSVKVRLQMRQIIGDVAELPDMDASLDTDGPIDRIDASSDRVSTTQIVCRMLDIHQSDVGFERAPAPRCS